MLLAPESATRTAHDWRHSHCTLPSLPFILSLSLTIVIHVLCEAWPTLKQRQNVSRLILVDARAPVRAHVSRTSKPVLKLIVVRVRHFHKPRKFIAPAQRVRVMNPDVIIKPSKLLLAILPRVRASILPTVSVPILIVDVRTPTIGGAPAVGTRWSLGEVWLQLGPSVRRSPELH